MRKKSYRKENNDEMHQLEKVIDFLHKLKPHINIDGMPKKSPFQAKKEFDTFWNIKKSFSAALIGLTYHQKRFSFQYT